MDKKEEISSLMDRMTFLQKSIINNDFIIADEIARLNQQD